MPASRANREHRRTLSLFSGAGGMDLGVSLAGFRNLLAVERDEHCAASLRANAGRKLVWQTDVRALDPSIVLRLLGMQAGELALLHGAPPRHDGAKASSRAQAGDAPVLEMVRFAEQMRPQCVLIEQAPSALGSWLTGDRRVVGELHRRFEALGYDLHVELLDAGVAGVSQTRVRAVLVAVPSGFAFDLTIPAAEGAETVAGAWQGLPDPAVRGGWISLANHVDVTPPRARKRIRHVPEGSWLSKVVDAPEAIRGKLGAKDTTKFRRLARDAPSPTLFAGEIFFHPTEDRYITPREAARLQGFPDTYVFHGPIGRRTSASASFDQHRQVAEATPPPFAKALASKIADLISA